MRIEKRQFDERIEAELVDLAYRHGANAAHEEQAVYVKIAAWGDPQHSLNESVSFGKHACDAIHAFM